VSCIFCDIVAERAPASFVHRDDDVVAFMDLRPINVGHLLVVPRQHAVLVGALEPRIAAAVWATGLRLSAVLRTSGFRCDGVSFYVADGEPAGQEVPHVHLHVIPRWPDDGFGFRFRADYGERERFELDVVALGIRETIRRAE